MAQVHYWELSNYNSGKLIGQWFGLDCRTHQEHLEEIQEWLEELTEETGELCEEWILGDVEGVPDCYVSEYSIDPEYFRLQEIADTTHLDLEIVEAGAGLGIPLESIEDAYCGTFSSDNEFAEELLDSCGYLDQVPEFLQGYFDYDAWTRDVMIDHNEHGGHYFHNSW